MIPGPHSERALVLAPRGRDAAVAVHILREAGLAALQVGDLSTLVQELEQGAGLALIADEAVQTQDLRSLVEFLSRQSAWSPPRYAATHAAASA